MRFDDSHRVRLFYITNMTKSAPGTPTEIKIIEKRDEQIEILANLMRRLRLGPTTWVHIGKKACLKERIPRYELKMKK